MNHTSKLCYEGKKRTPLNNQHSSQSTGWEITCHLLRFSGVCAGCPFQVLFMHSMIHPICMQFAEKIGKYFARDGS